MPSRLVPEMERRLRFPSPLTMAMERVCLVARRSRRALNSARSIAVTGTIALFVFHAKVAAVLGASGVSAGKLGDPVVSRDEQMLTVITVMLVALTDPDGDLYGLGAWLPFPRRRATTPAPATRFRRARRPILAATAFRAFRAEARGGPLDESRRRRIVVGVTGASATVFFSAVLSLLGGAGWNGVSS